MISEKMQQLLNRQINREFFSAYLYLSMEAYFASENLNGFANWFHVQAQEERDHAMMFYQYVHHVGGKVILDKIDAPQVDFANIREVLEKTLEHERFVTSSIYEIVDQAIAERDHKSNAFLQWFVNEQAEEEANAEANLGKFKLVEGDGRGILMLDADFATRVYTPPSGATAQA